MSIKCITFDLDDTLWSTYPVIVRAEARFRQWLDHHFPHISKQFSAQQLWTHRYQYFEKHPELQYDISQLQKNWMSQLMFEHGYNDDKVEEGFSIFWQERNNLELFDHVDSVLSGIKKRFRTGAVTNGNADLHKIGINQYFDFYLTSAEVGYSKPHPAIFEATVSQAKCNANQILHIGDDPVRDVEGASKAGMKTIWFNRHKLTWQGTVTADTVVEQIDQLPDAIDRLISG